MPYPAIVYQLTFLPAVLDFRAMKHSRQPVALTIAGSDSGGGAGIQADLKTFAAQGVHGASVITCLTAQNPKAVLGIQPCRPAMVDLQLEAIFSELKPGAVKTGMLYSKAIIAAVVEFLERQAGLLLIVDPVMVATCGRPLMQRSVGKDLGQKLLRLAKLVTPNLSEAGILIGRSLASPEDLRLAAREIHARYGCAALVKGGHLGHTREAIDFYCDGQSEFSLAAPRVRGVKTHGTGCAYSAAITGYCALGCPLPLAVKKAKQYITQAIARHVVVNGCHVLNHFRAASDSASRSP